MQVIRKWSFVSEDSLVCIVCTAVCTCSSDVAAAYERYKHTQTDRHPVTKRAKLAA